MVAEQKVALLNGFTAVSVAGLAEVAGWGAVVLVVALFGWAVSSLEQLAGWTDDAPRLAKLTIVKGIFASIAAAAFVVMLGNWQGWHPLVIVACAFLGGMAGDKLLRPLSDNLIARCAGVFDALLGRGPRQEQRRNEDTDRDRSRADEDTIIRRDREDEDRRPKP